ncbi:MAG: DUF2332 domain-containing protein [Gammaproteobacteria bacterium]
MGIPERLERYAAECRLHEATLVHAGAPMYAALCGLMARDIDMLELAAHTAPNQIPDIAVLGAANYLLLGEPDTALARHHPICTGRPAVAADLYPGLRAFCLDRAQAIAEIVATRPIQYTAPGRAALVLPPIALAARDAGAPMTLVEAGCSVGFNLMFGHFHYDYGAAGTVGDPHSPVHLKCEVQGAPEVVRASMPAGVPAVAARIGIDLNLIDVDDPDQYRWLLANLWPEQLERRRNFEAAIGLLRSDPPRFLRGNALDHLPALLADGGGPLCLLHSVVLYYFSAEEMQRLEQMLLAASRHRLIHRIGIEYWSALDARSRQAELDQGKRAPPEIRHFRYAGGEVQSRVLARCDNDGGFIKWL